MPPARASAASNHGSICGLASDELPTGPAGAVGPEIVGGGGRTGCGAGAGDVSVGVELESRAGGGGTIRAGAAGAG